jgi:SET domain-containing protein
MTTHQSNSAFFEANGARPVAIPELPSRSRAKTYVGHVAGAGRGVFATEDIAEGEVIEVSEVIIVPPEEVQLLDRTALERYYFAWGDDLKSAAIALGHGSLYNHSFSPNARYEKHFDQGILEFICINAIKKGEEIRVNYNHDPHDQTPVRFEVR